MTTTKKKPRDKIPRPPPSWIRLTWTVDGTAQPQIPRWRYQMTWGPENSPRFQVSDDLQADLGKDARIGSLYAAISTQAEVYLRGAAYDLRGSAPCVWELRPNPAPGKRKNK